MNELDFETELKALKTEILQMIKFNSFEALDMSLQTIGQNIKNKALKLIGKYSARLKAEQRENRILQSEVYAKEEQIKYLKNNVKLAQSHFELSE